MHIPFTFPVGESFSMIAALRRAQVPVTRTEYIRYLFVRSMYYDFIGDVRSAEVFANLALVLAQRPSLYSTQSH